MRVGISTACYFTRESTERAAALIKQSGVQTSEVFFQTFYEYRPEFAKALSGDIAGLTVNSVHVVSGNFEGNLFSPVRRIRGDGFYWLDQIMRSAQLLGCKNYTFHGQARCDIPDYDEYAGYLADAKNFCARYGVNLCLENVCWCMYNHPGVFGEFKKRVPDLKGVFDIKQARRSHYPYGAYIEDMSGSIAYAHLSDVDENGNIRLPGKGLYDFEEIIKRLKGTGFDGDLIIEVYPDDFGEPEELKQSADYLNEIICKIG